MIPDALPPGVTVEELPGVTLWGRNQFPDLNEMGWLLVGSGPSGLSGESVPIAAPEDESLYAAAAAARGLGTKAQLPDLPTVVVEGTRPAPAPALPITWQSPSALTLLGAGLLALPLPTPSPRRPARPRRSKPAPRRRPRRTSPGYPDVPIDPTTIPDRNLPPPMRRFYPLKWPDVPAAARRLLGRIALPLGIGLEAWDLWRRFNPDGGSPSGPSGPDPIMLPDLPEVTIWGTPSSPPDPFGPGVQPLPFAPVPGLPTWSDPWSPPMPTAPPESVPVPLAPPAPVSVPLPTLQPFPEPWSVPSPRPSVRPSPRPSPRPGVRPSPRPGSPGPGSPLNLGLPDVVAQPQPRPAGCPPCQAKKDKKKRRQPREVCYRGTYTERSKSLIKARKEQIPCR